ncbi:hypothetical protein P2318_04590 [Myxococcaceae bacterium GXIMD 01537]
MRGRGGGGWWAGLLGAALLVGCESGGPPQTRPVTDANPEPQPGLVTPPPDTPEDPGGETQQPGPVDVPPTDTAQQPDDDDLPPPDDSDEVRDPDEDPAPSDDSATPDGGVVDSGGSQSPPDGGVVTVPPSTPPGPPPPINFPTIPGWRFYGPQHGAPSQVLGVTEDDDGNLWVAGGEEGLFVLRSGASTFQRFTLAEGLRPYGFLQPNGTAPKGDKYLKVTAVTGGKGGTVYVGYQGYPDCESNYYAGKPIKDARSYKSGDADKVTLLADGTLSVVHYDISSGKGVVSEEAGGREKLCTIHRIAYDRQREFLWFGANHGFAWGDPNYAGDPSCPGKRECSGVMEHTHPHVEAMSEDGTHVYRLTDAYWGIAVRPDGDVWFGGANRTTRFKFMSVRADTLIDSARFELARKNSESTGAKAKANRLDVWPDATNPDLPGGRPAKPSERVDDNVSGLALMANNTLWVSSFAHGLAQLDEKGVVLSKRFETGPERYVSALTRDARDESLWVGFRWGSGLARLRTDGTVERYGGVLTRRLERLPVTDLQVVGAGAQRRVLVGFGKHEDGSAGAIGVYEGE